MGIGQYFSSFFSGNKTVKCQPSHQQRQQNQKFSQQIQKLDLQSIRKQHGRLDDRFEQVIEDANLQSAYKVQKYMKEYRGLLQKVDNYCTQNKSHKYSDKRQCIQQMDGHILDIFEKPFIKSQLNLYRVANSCLIKGQNFNKCVQQVKNKGQKVLNSQLILNAIEQTIIKIIRFNNNI